MNMKHYITLSLFTCLFLNYCSSSESSHSNLESPRSEPSRRPTGVIGASAVAAFGMLLRDSVYKGNANWKDTYNLAKQSIGKDKEGYRSEFLTLVDKAKSLSKK